MPPNKGMRKRKKERKKKTKREKQMTPLSEVEQSTGDCEQEDRRDEEVVSKRISHTPGEPVWTYLLFLRFREMGLRLREESEALEEMEPEREREREREPEAEEDAELDPE
mgnify:CR=1 FL=1